MKQVRILMSGALALTQLACNDPATKTCQSELSQAQGVVNQVDAASAESVENAEKSVDRALAACRAAKRSQEAEQLQRAKAELSTHRTALANRKPRVKKNAASEEELILRGDPSCPRGLAYKAENSDKQIKCSGPQPVRMNAAVAEEHYRGRGYRVTSREAPAEVRAERNAELLIFSYAAPRDPGPPVCLTLYPPPGVPWQEIVSRTTGAQPTKIQLNKPVPLPDGAVPLQVIEDPQKLIIRLGSCPGAVAR